MNFKQLSAACIRNLKSAAKATDSTTTESVDVALFDIVRQTVDREIGTDFQVVRCLYRALRVEGMCIGNHKICRTTLSETLRAILVSCTTEHLMMTHRTELSIHGYCAL